MPFVNKADFAQDYLYSDLRPGTHDSPTYSQVSEVKLPKSCMHHAHLALPISRFDNRQSCTSVVTFFWIRHNLRMANFNVIPFFCMLILKPNEIIVHCVSISTKRLIENSGRPWMSKNSFHRTRTFLVLFKYNWDLSWLGTCIY